MLMSSRHARIPLLLSTALVVAACGGSDAPAATKQTASQPAAHSNGDTIAAVDGAGAKEARALFDSLCFTCHGLHGHGDGPGAAAMNPKPRSFADAAWQDSVTDEQITKTIVFGGAAVGKSPMMPPQPQLKGKDDTLAALVKIVRGFRGK